MKKYKLNNSGLEISRIAYGCMKLGIIEMQSDVDNIINTAIENGIDFFDHADIYCNGRSEEVFGNWLAKNSSYRKNVFIQSKCGIRFAGHPNVNSPQRYDFSYEHIKKSVENSLKRLKTDFLDVLLLHRPDPLCNPEEVAKAFDELFNEGKVKFFGVSNHNPLQIELLKKYLNQPLIINQIEFNLLHNYLIDDGIMVNLKNSFSSNLNSLIDYCRLNDILIQAWGPLAQGRIDNDIKYSGLKGKINQIALKKEATLEEILLSWILRHPARIQPIVGTNNLSRIVNCCKSTNIDLNREEWYALYIETKGCILP